LLQNSSRFENGLGIMRETCISRHCDDKSAAASPAIGILGIKFSVTDWQRRPVVDFEARFMRGACHRQTIKQESENRRSRHKAIVYG
jgi:hypothetical protein